MLRKQQLQKRASQYEMYGEEPTDKKKRNSNIEKLWKKNKQLNSDEAANKDMLSSVTQGLPILQSSTIY